MSRSFGVASRVRISNGLINNDYWERRRICLEVLLRKFRGRLM